MMNGNAILGYSPRLVLPYFEDFSETVTLNASGISVAKPDPARVLLAFNFPDIAALSTIQLWYKNPNGNPALISMPSSGEKELFWQRHGSIVTREWFARVSAGSPLLTVTWVRYMPEKGALRNETDDKQIGNGSREFIIGRRSSVSGRSEPDIGRVYSACHNTERPA